MLIKEQLSPHALELFRRTKLALPEEISSRLRSNRYFVTHGSYADLFLFDVWDGNQTDVLDRKHFKYCLGYDGRQDARHNGYFHLWLNKIRIYREREPIVTMLERELPRVVPKGFAYIPSDRAFNIHFAFTFPADLSHLPDLLLPRYISLISVIHPILMPIIDQFSTALAPGERRATVQARGRIEFTHPGVRDPDRVREYTRSVPPSWKPRILARYSHRCALCDADLKQTGYHFDHILAFSRGGTTIEDNLQPLCPPCNLKKGNR